MVNYRSPIFKLSRFINLSVAIPLIFTLSIFLIFGLRKAGLNLSYFKNVLPLNIDILPYIQINLIIIIRHRMVG